MTVAKEALLRIHRWGKPRVTFRDCPNIIKAMSVPTLVLTERHAPDTPLSHVERLKETIPGSQLMIVEDGGHFLPMDTSEDVAQEITAFIG
jgi:pimeloyl-ACP methyl ester carboxylesterase